MNVTNQGTEWPSEFRQSPLELKDELKKQNFCLHHHAYEDFHRSQWQSKPTCCCFLIYRWILAAFFCSGTVSCMILYFNKGLWFIYLTNWGFLLCGITSLLGAICTTIYHINPQKMVERVCLIKCYWACYWTNLIVAYVISSIYWIFIYPKHRNLDQSTALFIYNIWTHAMPIILFTLDHMLVAQPARLLHFIYPFIFGLIYLTFTYIYFLLGGLGRLGRRYIYKMLDYESYETWGIVVIVFIFLTACSILQYGLYRLRVLIAHKLQQLE